MWILMKIMKGGFLFSMNDYLIYVIGVASGHLTHDDKECALWLRSKGTLSVQDQQFGLWIRASQFNPAKKSRVEVQGYETMPGASRMRGGQVGRDKSDTVPVSVSIGNMESSNVSGESGKSLAHQSKVKFPTL